jgi:two-component system chemotaxis response regulator CheB
MPGNLAIVGMSTGGPRMLEPLFGGMPVLNGSIILVLHMPVFINSGIIAFISRHTAMNVKLAEHGEATTPGTIYVAPSNLHLKLAHDRRINLAKGPKVNYVCPSIDVTMQSVLPVPGTVVAGAILTGMGSDGARGIAYLKSIGAVTLAQDAATSIIFSMPDSAIRTGCVDFVVPPQQMQGKLTDLFGVLPPPPTA